MSTSTFLGSYYGWSLPAILVTTIGAYLASTAIYDVFFHPLSRVPGPFMGKLTRLYYAYTILGGRSIQTNLLLHEKYGPVVRLAPNFLSFATPEAAKTIYGPDTGRKYLKGAFYDCLDTQRDLFCLRDPAAHTRTRRMIGHGFSVKSVREQEYIVQQHVNTFIKEIGTRAQDGQKPVEITKWLKCLTFDIVSDLVTGASFGGVKAGGELCALAVVIPWVFILAFFLDLARAYVLRPIVFKLLMMAESKEEKAEAAENKKALSKKFQTLDRRHDALYQICKARDESISEVEMHEIIDGLVAAGGDTTMSGLVATIYLVLSTPGIKATLVDEIRQSLESYEKITMEAVEHLPFLNACINEGLRMFPPAPTGLPRVALEGSVIEGVFVPAGTELASGTGALTRGPKYWRNAQQFNPNRWLDPACTDALEASTPFSLGRRSCVAKNLAWMELRVILAKMFYALDIELEDNKDWMAGTRSMVVWSRPELELKMRFRSERAREEVERKEAV